MVDFSSVILITGASSGIGAALAETYAEPGVTLLLMGRDEARLGQVAHRCRARGASVQIGVADVRDKVAMHTWIATQDEQHPIDLVIANAGVSAGTFVGEKSMSAAHNVFDVNVDGVLNTIHPLIPRMVARKSGQIAIISSLAGIMPWPGAAAYSASKAAVRYYGEALRAQLHRSGVSVTVVCPGWIRTPLVEHNQFPMPLIMSAERSAQIIRRGISQKKMRVAFPFSIYLALRFASMLPAALTHFISARMPMK